MSLDTKTALAVYAAGLSTTTALVGFARMIRDRPSVAVHAAFAFASLSQDAEAAATTRGTLVEMHEQGLMYECTVTLRIVNRGRRAVEVVAVLVEGLSYADSPTISAHEIRPQGLPAVLEPLSSIETTIQKEHFDQNHLLLFLGVVDALGHRHAADDDDVRKMLETNQTLPTSIAVFQRRDDPAKKVTAWSTKDATALTTRPLPSTRWPLGREKRRIRFAQRRAWPQPVSPAADAMRTAIRTAADE